MSPLHLDNVTSDPDERLRNLLAATSHETGDVADIARWAIRNLLTHRAALKEIRDAVPGCRAIAERGLLLSND